MAPPGALDDSVGVNEGSVVERRDTARDGAAWLLAGPAAAAAGG